MTKFNDCYGQKCLIKKEKDFILVGVQNTGKHLKNKEVNKFMKLDSNLLEKFKPAFEAFLDESWDYMSYLNEKDNIFEFKDLDGEECTIQESSSAEESCLWFGKNGNRMHLSVKEMKKLYLKLYGEEYF